MEPPAELMDPPKSRRGDKVEPFAKALARGLTTREAAAEAGYSPTCGFPSKKVKEEAFRAHVAELARESPFIGPDLRPVIALLMDGAREALATAKKKESAAGYTAATRMLAEAARLKQRLPNTTADSEEMEWLRRWCPDD